MEPVRLVLLQQLLEERIRGRHIFFEVVPAQSVNLVHHRLVPCEAGNIDFKLLPLCVAHQCQNFVGVVELEIPHIIDEVEEDRLHVEHPFAELLHHRRLLLHLLVASQHRVLLHHGDRNCLRPNNCQLEDLR